jgi:hypothetical protein
MYIAFRLGISIYNRDATNTLFHSFTGAYSPGRTFGLPFRGFLITQTLLCIEVSQSHTIRHKVGLLWTSDQPVAEASTYTEQHNI